jgi:hypothetical protein
MLRYLFKNIGEVSLRLAFSMLGSGKVIQTSLISLSKIKSTSSIGSDKTTLLYALGSKFLWRHDYSWPLCPWQIKFLSGNTRLVL